jgi:hypothetical protein
MCAASENAGTQEKRNNDTPRRPHLFTYKFFHMYIINICNICLYIYICMSPTTIRRQGTAVACSEATGTSTLQRAAMSCLVTAACPPLVARCRGVHPSPACALTLQCASKMTRDGQPLYAFLSFSLAWCATFGCASWARARVQIP